MTRKSLTIPDDLVAKVDELLLDPATARPGYGSWSELITQLLEQHIRHYPKHKLSSPGKAQNEATT